MDVRGSIFLIWKCYSDPLTKWPEKLLVLSWAQNKRRLCNRSRLSCKVLCLLDQQIQSMVLEVAGPDGDVVWSLCRTLLVNHSIGP